MRRQRTGAQSLSPPSSPRAQSTPEELSELGGLGGEGLLDTQHSTGLTWLGDHDCLVAHPDEARTSRAAGIGRHGERHPVVTAAGGSRERDPGHVSLRRPQARVLGWTAAGIRHGTLDHVERSRATRRTDRDRRGVDGVEAAGLRHAQVLPRRRRRPPDHDDAVARRIPVVSDAEADGARPGAAGTARDR